MKETTKKKRPVLRILLGVLAVCILACTWYMLDYSHASDHALRIAQEGSETVDVIRDDSTGNLTFVPEGDIRCGLIFYPGGKVQYESYAPLMTKLAEKGVLCVLLKVTCNLAILDMNAAEGITGQYPMIQNWYIGGHSLGGVVSTYYAYDHSDELDGVLLLGAYSNNDLSQTNLKVLCMYGSNDRVMNRENYEKYREYLPADYKEVVIEGGNHAGFGDYGEQKGDGPAEITGEEQRNQTAEAVLMWIEGELE